ncbi:hypothetical protein QN277_010511 [Acacia crassicarpa]|uniref:Uncharacterized protein n=1 Tax=Acacia crassicarpa TaxID=499986 RepID=A0AAE1INX7_9FABA|nr:hypothetical protein QN277_010511 [Acacia crassicarpa]
MLGLAWRRRSI